VKEILVVTALQRNRLIQLEEGIHNINNVERTMEFIKQGVVFVGPEDHELQIDRDVIKGAKGGLSGVVNELIYEYVVDPDTGREVRVKNEEMKKIATEIISIARQIIMTPVEPLEKS
jgi:hypothetical protein